MAIFEFGVATVSNVAQGAPRYPAYDVGFAYNGTQYSLSIIMINATSLPDDSTDLDAAVQTMVSALASIATVNTYDQVTVTRTGLTA